MNLIVEGMNLIAFDMWREYRRILAADETPMLIVYDRPPDFPERAVVRLFAIARGTNDGPRPERAWTFHNVDSARRSKPPELIVMARSPDDDAKVVEVWV